MGRAKLDPGPIAPPFATDLGPAALGYDELYALFAASFDEVSLAGVVPFAGVVFAELGGDDESPAVSVDTRFAPAEAPSIFVVVARQEGPPGDRQLLDPYAIVQVTETETGTPREATIALETAFAASQLRSELLASQLDETRDRLVIADVRTVEAAARLDRAAVERDGALTRAMELETILSAAQQMLAVLERRLLEAEQAVLEREERLAVFAGALEATRAIEAVPSVDIVDLLSRAESAEAAFSALAERQEVELDELRERAEHGERAFAAQGADLAHVADAHGVEMASYEEQLRDRARLIAALEKELARREQLVLELVTSLEDARGGSAAPLFEASLPLSISPDPQIAILERNLDALAAEVARREGELTARGWRITELENALAARPARSVEPPSPSPGPMHDEVDALRQALAQEHAARVAAESGEELTHARAELARQAALLDQMRGRPS